MLHSLEILYQNKGSWSILFLTMMLLFLLFTWFLARQRAEAPWKLTIFSGVMTRRVDFHGDWQNNDRDCNPTSAQCFQTEQVSETFWSARESDTWWQWLRKNSTHKEYFQCDIPEWIATGTLYVENRCSHLSHERTEDGTSYWTLYNWYCDCNENFGELIRANIFVCMDLGLCSHICILIEAAIERRDIACQQSMIPFFFRTLPPPATECIGRYIGGKR